MIIRIMANVTNHPGVENLEASTRFLSDNDIAVEELVLFNHVYTYICFIWLVLREIVQLSLTLQYNFYIPNYT